jgi:hypothetical protein
MAPVSAPSRFFPGLLIGFILGAAASVYLQAGHDLLSSVLPSSRTQGIVRCAAEVPSLGWKRLRSDRLGFEVRFPDTFKATETGDTLSIVSTDKNPEQSSIVLEKMKGYLRDAILPEMRQGSWKIADRQVYALVTPAFTDEDHLDRLSEHYLFVRDFPLKGDNGEYSMVKATVTFPRDNADFLSARAIGIIDHEAILTEPEQILSTFRFLQYDELPGRDTGRGKDV